MLPESLIQRRLADDLHILPVCLRYGIKVISEVSLSIIIGITVNCRIARFFDQSRGRIWTWLNVKSKTGFHITENLKCLILRKSDLFLITSLGNSRSRRRQVLPG